jgi:hypothetical protein
MTSTYRYRELTVGDLGEINLLQQRYGEFLGNAKARHQEYSKQLSILDDDITTCFAKITQFSSYKTIFQILNIAIGKIAELISFVETIESTPLEEKVTKSAYNKFLAEKESLQKTVEIMVQYKGVPELNKLLETAKNNQLPTDEYWVLALCSSNLIEAVVNKKLRELDVKVEGSFKEKYRKLCSAIKEKEGTNISQLLPLALYDGIRN